MENKDTKILEEIDKSLKEINARFETEEIFSESDNRINKAENRVENSLNQIQNTFDRIHDKVFNFNNILIGAYMLLGTFPSDSPILPLWTVLFPILILVFLIFLDINQMEIHRFASREMEWMALDREKYGKKISRQTILSLIALFCSILCLLYLIYNLF